MRRAPAGTCTDADGPTAVMRLPSTTMVRVLDDAGRALDRPGFRPAIVMTRAPTSAIAPAGLSLVAVKPMAMPFASGSSGFWRLPPLERT